MGLALNRWPFNSITTSTGFDGLSLMQEDEAPDDQLVPPFSSLGCLLAILRDCWVLGDPELMDEALDAIKKRAECPTAYDSIVALKAIMESLPEWGALPSGLREATLRAAVAAERFRAQINQSVLDSPCMERKQGGLPLHSIATMSCVDECTQAAILSMFEAED